MATISKNYTFSAGAVIVASEHNSNNDTIYNDYNGNITNVNLASGAAIVDTKLAQITTASKVNLSALVISSQAAGDIIYASSATALTRLAAGSSGQFLKSAGTAAPSWASAAENGMVVQVVNVIDGAVATGTGQIPNDDTIPSSSEGTEFMSLSITPNATSNKLKIDTFLNLAASDVSLLGGAALFQDATTAAIASMRMESQSGAANQIRSFGFTHFMTAATTAQTTFKVRAGYSAAATITFNGISGSRRWGGSLASSITITEIKSA